MDYRRLKVSRGPVASVRLDRPEVRNAMDAAFFLEIAHCFRALSADDAVRVVVLSAEGKDFCAGADIGWMRESGRLKGEASRKDAALIVDMCRAVAECRVPVVARVHGSVFGGGLGLVASCDVAVAGAGGRMCFSECRLGILPAVISAFVLPKIGSSFARRYYLTAEPFGMEEARRMGLVHEVVPEAELDARVSAVAGSILKTGPNAVRQAKTLIREICDPEFEGRVSRCLDALVQARATPEAQEGLMAFLEKRPASWVKAGG
ncbi:MAG: enoyl-CoA hydratase-related protein [Elusimicrobiota bacterium]|jgi:methylglutaconyl-CoA hydratase